MVENIQQANQAIVEGNSMAKLKRLQVEKQTCEKKQKGKKFPENFVYIKQKQSTLGPDLNTWYYKFKGLPNSLLEGGYYEVEFSFAEVDYPNKPPKLKFLNKFEHMHVYLSGEICLPSIAEHKGWRVDKTIYDICLDISNMVHGQPKVEDTASHKMRDIFNKDPKAYEQHLRDQSKVFAQYA